MSANINENRMFCVGKCWHEFGKRVEQEQTAENAIKLAQLNYNIIKKPLFTDAKILDNFEAVVREDNNEILGIVSPKYKIVQNIDAFSFFDTIIGEGQAVYNSAGALGKGERIWLLAKLPSEIVINTYDKIEKYLCLTSSHDGKSSIKVYFTPIRVVCQNTLNQSLQNIQNGISIRHMGNIKAKVEEARRVLGISVNYYEQFEGIIKQFEEKPLTVNEVEQYFNKVLDIKENEEISTRKENIKGQLEVLFEKGKGANIGNKHSLWKGYNAITEYVDHYSTIKNLDNDKSNLTKNILFGTGAKMKEKAYNEAVALIS